MQLGYVAYCTIRQNENVYSFQVLVQSGTHSPSDVLLSIDTFLSGYKKTLSDYLSTSSNFDSLRSVHNDVLQIKPLTLSDATDTYWPQIQSGLQQFDFIQQVVNVSSSLTAEDLMNFYVDNILSGPSAKKLAVVVYGSDKGSALDPMFNFTNIDYVNIDPKQVKYP